MGLTDKYTQHTNAKKTTRYQAIGNSWAVPVIAWFGKRLLHERGWLNIKEINDSLISTSKNSSFIDLNSRSVSLRYKWRINSSSSPEKMIIGRMQDILSSVATPDIYISPVGCHGILRRKNERSLHINPQLERVLAKISSEMGEDEIEKRSLIQHRGKYGSHPFFGYNTTLCEKSKKYPLVLDLFAE